MISGVNIRAVENGFFMTYWDNGVSKDRAFLDWDSLCAWLKDQVAGLPTCPRGSNMLRVVLEGKDAEEYLNLRKRNSELASKFMEYTKKNMELQRQLNEQPKPIITLTCDPNGNVVDIAEEKPKRRFGTF